MRRVGILHGAAVDAKGNLQPHTRARAETALRAYSNRSVHLLLVCGRREANPIASYLIDRGVGKEEVITENLSYSTLSNLYYSKILLHFLDGEKVVEKVVPISNYWHIPRLSYDAKKILSSYSIECLPAEDPRESEVVERERRKEKYKFFVDATLLKLGYGREFDRKIEPFRHTYGKEVKQQLEDLLLAAIPPSQKRLMRMERLLFSIFVR